jgi:two-component system chemotaxis response regulator CheY
MAGKKILIIDDSSAIRHQVRGVLNEAGFTTLEAVDGLDGAQQIRSCLDLALVICDVNMPRLGGLEMLESIKDEISSRALRIMMLTTEADPAAIARAKSSGARAWMVKPFKDRLLVAAATKLTA